jgi:hypothetical protein
MFIATKGNINVSKHFPTGNKITAYRSWAASKPEGCTAKTREKWLTCNQFLCKGRSSCNLQQTRPDNSPAPVPVLSQINPVHATHPTSRRSILILSSHLPLGLPSGLSIRFPLTKTLYSPLLSARRATRPPPT